MRKRGEFGDGPKEGVVESHRGELGLIECGIWSDEEGVDSDRGRFWSERGRVWSDRGTVGSNKKVKLSLT